MLITVFIFIFQGEPGAVGPSGESGRPGQKGEPVRFIDISIKFCFSVDIGYYYESQ